MHLRTANAGRNIPLKTTLSSCIIILLQAGCAVRLSRIKKQTKILSPGGILKHMPVVDAVRRKTGGAEVDVLVSPKAGRSGVEGYDKWRKRIIVKVMSPPVEGKANKETEDILKEITGFSSIVVKGHTSRQKTLFVEGDPDQIAIKLRDSVER